MCAAGRNFSCDKRCKMDDKSGFNPMRCRRLHAPFAEAEPLPQPPKGQTLIEFEREIDQSLLEKVKQVFEGLAAAYPKQGVNL